MTERELEKLFRSKLNNREFPVNEENWARMESMLDANQVKAGAFYWRSVAAILLFAISVLGLHLYDGQVNLQGENSIASPSSQKIRISPVDEISTDTELMKIQDKVENASSLSSVENESVASENTGQPKNLGDINSRRVALVEGNQLTTTGEVSENSIEIPEELSLIRKKERPGLYASFTGLAGLKSFSSVGASASPFAGRSYNGNLLIIAGPVFSGSYNNNAMGTGFQAGLAYEYKFANKVNIQVGLNYVRLNNVGITDQSDSTFFNFGMERIETESVCDRLDYLEVPVSISYQVLPKHELGVSTYASVLINASQETNKTTYASKAGTSVENNSSSGYNENFSRYDLGIGAFYRYTFNQSFSMGIHINKGLVDITTTDDLTSDYDHVNLNTRIELRYNIF